ncbi:uncharacterized protein LOC111627248 [Centruroides sculpturatus]|uniref:uncharacterized protein LOC111627248 n=1 Tax=Centruroides sculpturatus TaxID=218467 RepID=UPI000C6D1B44|nr:uncharacterized protein LOC111627248 [Centruroides sculpturatus]
MGELLLYSLDRRINLEQQIWPALAANKVVLCDRYLDSSLVYQGYAGELGIEQVLKMQKFITRNTFPDITFLFELPLKQAKVRTQSRSKLDRFDAVNRQFRQMIHEGYDQVRQMFANRFHIIDASRDRANVLQQVQTVLKKVLKLD